MTELVSVTDASSQIGLGHAMRQLSLAQAALKRGWRVRWISTAPRVAALAETHAIPHMLVSDLGDVCSRIDDDSRILLDVHQSDFAKLRCDATITRGLLLVSEVGCDFAPYGAHLVRVGNQLGYWTDSRKHTHTHGQTMIHAGRAWMIFRDEFTRARQMVPKQPNHVLVCHGGSDPHRLTELSLEALELVGREIFITVLVTDAFPNIEDVLVLARANRHRCDVVRNAREVRGFMESASVAVINGGNVRYELCLTGTPYVAVSFQRTQYVCTEQLAAQGVGLNVGLMTEVTASMIAEAVTDLLDDQGLRTHMATTMMTLFDTSGADRVLDLMSGDNHA